MMTTIVEVCGQIFQVKNNADRQKKLEEIRKYAEGI